MAAFQVQTSSFALALMTPPSKFGTLHNARRSVPWPVLLNAFEAHQLTVHRGQIDGCLFP